MKQSEEHKKLTKRLTTALILIGIAAVIAAVILFFSIPEDVKVQFIEHHRSFVQGAEGQVPPPFYHGTRHHGHGFLLVAVIAVLVIAAVRHKMHAVHMYHGHCGGTSAMEILRREYAAGDISKDEYLARKEVLERGEGGEE